MMAVKSPRKGTQIYAIPEDSDVFIEITGSDYTIVIGTEER